MQIDICQQHRRVRQIRTPDKIAVIIRVVLPYEPPHDKTN